MSTVVKLKSSVVKDKLPSAADLLIGEVCVGANSESPMLLFKDNADNIVKIGPGSGVIISPDEPTGSAGELWYDSSNGLLYYYNGNSWVELGTAGDSPVVSVNGKVGTVVLTAADVGAATTAQGALADSAIQPGVVNPVYFANEADFPDPALPSVHGGVAHSHAANAMFYAHNAQWLQLANVADTVPLGSWSSIPALT